MEDKVSAKTGTSYRNAGWAAITSGVIGILAYGLVLAAVLTRTTWILTERVYLFFRAHDVGVVVQFLLMVFVALGLQKLSSKNPPVISKAVLATGVGASLFVALLLLLGIAKVVSDGFYMFPQAIFGVWLIVICWRFAGLLPRWLRWFGMIVGLGLALVGIAWFGIGIFATPSQFHIPAVPLENFTEPDSQANTFFHQVLWVGSYMGVATLPLWTFLTGFQFLKKKRVDAIE